MPNLHGLPYFEVQFTKSGAVHRAAEADALRRFVREESPSDLLVISHGWNNDLEDARSFYDQLLRSLRAERERGAVDLGDRSFGVLAIFWPSKKFTDENLVPGGAAGLAGDSPESELRRELDERAAPSGIGDDTEVDPEITERLERARALVDRLEESPGAREEFVAIVRGLLPPAEADAEIRREEPAELRELDGDELLERLGTPPPLAPPPEPEGGAAILGGSSSESGGAIPDDPGGAAFLGDLFSGVVVGARQLLNLTTYYTMKARARVVGEAGVVKLLEDLADERRDLRLHLVGHSFGARLVSSAATVSRVPVASLVLLQAAFSHHGFAPAAGRRPQGVFRRAVAVENKIRGPILVTHTANDRAVGLAYPIASRIARQVAESLGGPDDLYGGLGRNGARDTAEAAFGDLLGAGTRYRFAPGKRIHNLLADRFIRGHSEVKGREVAHAVLSAIAET